MILNDLIKRIKFNSRLKFKNDNNYYYSKNLSVDGKNIFVTLNGLQTYRKLLNNLEQVDNYKIGDIMKNKNNLKETIKKIVKEGSEKSKKMKLIKNYIEELLDYMGIDEEEKKSHKYHIDLISEKIYLYVILKENLQEK